MENSRSEGAAKQEMIAFLVGAQEFCIDVVSVREIRVWTPATPVAHAPSFMCGLINLRGLVLPIINFANRLGLPSAEPTNRHAILVVQIGHQTVGLLVEGVTEILTIQRDLIQPTPDVASKAAKDFVGGVVAIDGRMISVISLDAVIPSAIDSVAA